MEKYCKGNNIAFVADSGGFTDVPGTSANTWFTDAMKWGGERGIITDTTFNPDDPCTRAQIVTFLWRAAGSPTYQGSTKLFVDVLPSSYCYDAVLWAVEQGITTGTSAATFSPSDTVTRGQAVTFLHRAAGSPAVSDNNPFRDVAANAYYIDAVQWAVGNSITTGTGNANFSPNNNCTCAQIITILYRSQEN